MGDQFLGKTNDREREEGADNHGDDAADERDEIGSGMRVVCDNLGDVVVHLYTFLSPNDTKEYPRPYEHDEDAKQHKNIPNVRPRSGERCRFFEIVL